MLLSRSVHPLVRRLALALVLLVLPTLAAAQTLFPGAITRPGTRGDQAIFYYDARNGFTTFLNVRNGGASALTVRVTFYGPTFATAFFQDVTIPVGQGSAGQPGVGGVVTIDVGSLRALGLPAELGLAFATAIDPTGQSIVTRLLSGNFTVANLATGSAWGGPALARSAIRPPTGNPDQCPPPTVVPPMPGTLIDGTDVYLTPIQPGNADLAAYYDPATLAPASIGGNQLIFAAFEDVPSTVFTAQAATTSWTIAAVRKTGEVLEPDPFEATGVEVSDLVSVLGANANGASGSATFTAPANARPLSRFVFFTESLGTFGTGYFLPRR